MYFGLQMGDIIDWAGYVQGKIHLTRSVKFCQGSM